MPQGDRPSSPLVSSDARLPYSKGLMARTLMGTGLSPARAYELAKVIEGRLGPSATAVGIAELQTVAAQVLEEEGAAEVLEHLSLLEQFYQLDIPLIILIGGTTGTGKSTIAAEVAHRLGIMRVTGTDVVRETIRAFFPFSVLPTVHYSTFLAAEGLRLPDYEPADPVLLGYLEQVSHVRVGTQAVIARAAEEGYSQVIEGAHLVPGDYLIHDQAILLVQFLLTVPGEDEHRRRFEGRDYSSHGKRPLEKYVANLREIRQIQDYLTQRADKNGVPVLDSTSSEEAVQAIMRVILEQVVTRTRGTKEANEPRSWLGSLKRRLHSSR